MGDLSVLSKARTRWGVDAFNTFIERIVWQCVQAGLVDGSKLFMDSSMAQADTSNNSVVNKESLKRYLNKSYQILESRLEQEQRSCGSDDALKSGTANKEFISLATGLNKFIVNEYIQLLDNKQNNP